jgi:hypothetical protein
VGALVSPNLVGGEKRGRGLKGCDSDARRPFRASAAARAVCVLGGGGVWYEGTTWWEKVGEGPGVAVE